MEDDKMDKMDDMDRDEMIDRYLRGMMSRDEEAEFIARLDNDKELRSDAIARARMARCMRQADKAVASELKGCSESKARRMAEPRRRRLRLRSGWIAVAACVAVIAVAGGYRAYDRYKVAQLGERYAQVFQLGDYVRGAGASEAEDELKMLLGNVSAGRDIKRTTGRLEELWVLSNGEIYNAYTDYAGYIGWYLATGYLANYDKENGKRVLQEIIDNEDLPEALREKAKELILKL